MGMQIDPCKLRLLYPGAIQAGPSYRRHIRILAPFARVFSSIILDVRIPLRTYKARAPTPSFFRWKTENRVARRVLS